MSQSAKQCIDRFRHTHRLSSDLSDEDILAQINTWRRARGLQPIR